MGRVFAVVALSLAACIDTGLVPCGDLACAAGDVCTPGGCSSPGDVAACDGLADGTDCKAVSGVQGTCVGGSCQTGLCGNGRLDPGEVCDDGNTVSGDGCRGDCTKIEVCGDGTVDTNEACDDGNTNPADGCDACTLTVWQATTVFGGSLDATKIGLAGPVGVALDRDGNSYIADTNNHLVRRVDSSGAITIAAGTGVAGYNGDGVAATSAELHSPAGVAVDGLGNLYIADTGNARIRRVDIDGIITTVAGTGIAGSGQDGVAATSSNIDGPYGLAVDGLGEIYLTESDSGRVRRVDTDGLIATVAGNLTIGFSGDNGPATSAMLDLGDPSGVAVDGAGNLYIADTNNHRVRRVDPFGIITTVAGTGTIGFTGDNGLATAARLYHPSGVAFGGGNLYIADTYNSAIRRVDPDGLITTFAGTGAFGGDGDGGPATAATLFDPFGVAIDAGGALYIADTDDNRIRRVDTANVITTVAGAVVAGAPGDGGAATSAPLNAPVATAVDAAGNVYISDTVNHRIRRVDTTGVITTIAGTGVEGFSGDGGQALVAQLAAPHGLAIDHLGNLYIADTSNNRIRRIDGAGVITTVAGGSAVLGDGGLATNAALAGPFGVAVDTAGNLYIADTDVQRVRRVDTNGIITTIAGTSAAGFNGDGVAANADLNVPEGVAVDGAGNVYISDTGNARIRRVTGGSIVTIAGTGTLGSSGDGGPATDATLLSPYGIAVDGAGNIYLSDGNRIRTVSAAGVISPVAGGMTGGTNGDGAAATNALLTFPKGVTVDGAGLLITDAGNNRIRRIDAGGVITTVAGATGPLGMGPFAQAHLADPIALALAPGVALVAGGSSGTLQEVSVDSAWVDVVAGRYPQTIATGALARFGARTFGSVSGVAYDAAAGVVYVSESSSNRVHAIVMVDPADSTTWTIASLSGVAGTAGFADGPASSALFRDPTGLYFEPTTRVLYVADTGNHVVRAIDLSGGVASATVSTVAGTAQTLGYHGDGGPATSGLLYEPSAIVVCRGGDLFIADSGNNRVRRVDATTRTITTVLGNGAAASSGGGSPASQFSVNDPLGLACDAIGNLFVTSTTTVQLVPSDASGIVDGTGNVQTIYGAVPRNTFPASITSCLTGLVVVDAATLEIADSCTGLLVTLHRQPK